MSWTQMLCETYDYAISCRAAIQDEYPLPPIGFKVEKVNMEIKLSEDGGFIDAVEIAKEEAYISVPATPKSIVARGAPVQPHPVFDKVKNLGSISQLDILRSWSNIDDSPDELKIILKYLEGNTILNDLKKCIAAKRITKKAEECFVRFRVITALAMDTALWNRKDFIDSWSHYYRSLCPSDKNDLCYINGKLSEIAVKHPFASGNTMLISMTPGNCIGRFQSDANEAVSIGLDTSLKLHSTRRWLMERQGIRFYGMEFVAWDTESINLPSPFNYDPDETVVIDTGIIDGKAIAAASFGYWSKTLGNLKDNSKRTIVILALDSAINKGRISVVYYQEFELNYYIDTLMYWYSRCAWVYCSKEKLMKLFSPTPTDICNLVYGDRNDKSTNKLKKHLVKEIMPCIFGRKPLPSSVITTVYNKLTNPVSYTENGKWNSWAWEKSLNIGCALIRKYYYDKGDEHTVILDENDNNRDYLFGRLLALADTVEQIAMSESDSKRMTNAMRYMQRFSQRPAETWAMFRTQMLIPYLNRLKPSQCKWYEKQFDMIQNKFECGDFAVQKPLGPRFLEGYSNQKAYNFSKVNVEYDKTDDDE